ncbi:Hcp family type VI secretion system effector [Massilia oculi]|uniref:Type VI secretion system tube protein Hcp n=1 Tax=Massilia oculi TaxID=945844 RepID=A0A2S2DG78_9BURK|nr:MULTISPECIES: type VI secretion system tube protein Hcp [Massilia]AWL04334.1 type VI secretion system tube protein Hcp [Massilia oculi]MDY0974767.1 type VI secretion system tube protein Hcp [Massilia sp. CFBP9012]
MAVDMFMNLDPIKGETIDDERKAKGDMDVLAWSWGMTQSGTTHMGGGGGGGKASFQDLSFTKYIDSATNALMKTLATGEHIPKAVLTVRKAGKGQQTYLTITMTQVLVTSISTGGSGGEDRLTENVTLNFAKVEVAYTPQDDKGTVAGDKTFTYNIAGNKAEG